MLVRRGVALLARSWLPSLAAVPSSSAACSIRKLAAQHQRTFASQNLALYGDQGDAASSVPNLNEQEAAELRRLLGLPVAQGDQFPPPQAFRSSSFGPIIQDHVTPDVHSPQMFTGDDSLYLQSSYPETIAEQHKNRMLSIPKEWVDLFFLEGFAGDIQKQFNDTHAYCILLRRKMIQLLDKIRNSNFENSPGFFLHGNEGNGKSNFLNLINLWARQTESITIFVPRMSDFTHRSAFIETKARNGKFDQPNEAIKMLYVLDKQYRARFERISIRGGAHMEQCAEQGIQLPYKVGDSLAKLCQEAYKETVAAPIATEHLLLELAQCTEYPVHLIVDEYNSMFENSAFFSHDQARDKLIPVLGTQLSLPALLHEFITQPRLKGFVLTSTSCSYANVKCQPEGSMRMSVGPLNFPEAEVLSKHWLNCGLLSTGEMEAQSDRVLQEAFDMAQAEMVQPYREVTSKPSNKTQAANFEPLTFSGPFRCELDALVAKRNLALSQGNAREMLRVAEAQEMVSPWLMHRHSQEHQNWYLGISGKRLPHRRNQRLNRRGPVSSSAALSLSGEPGLGSDSSLELEEGASDDPYAPPPCPKRF